MPSMSIVIPTYNTEEMTERCCGAVLESMPADAELIVVDDASNDGTTTRLARLARLRLIRLEQNLGFAGAANRGVDASTGDLVLLLNSDALVHGDALTRIVAAFERDGRLGVASAQLLSEDGTMQWTGGAFPTLPWILAVVSGLGSLVRKLRPRGSRGLDADVDWVSGAAMAFRRSVWRDAGPLDEAFAFYAQDVEFCWRARQRGWDVRILGDAHVTHRRGATIASSALQYDPAKLWPDLLRWRELHHTQGKTVVRLIVAAAAILRVAVRFISRGFRADTATQQMSRAVGVIVRGARRT